MRKKVRDTIIQQKAESNGPSRSVGIYLHDMGDPSANYASDRIRGKWIANNSADMEIFIRGREYEVVIFHSPCAEINQYGKIKILDICDKVWEKNVQTFITQIKNIHAIVVPTEILKEELSVITDKPIYVIEDGHDFNHYNTRLSNSHKDIAEEAVWFGYAENAHVLKPFINYLKSSGIKLKVISQRQDIPPLEFADEFIQWDEKTYISEISKSDFAILPPNMDYKSNNKEITALLSGIPVAKTKEDIARFIDPENRKKEMLMRQQQLIHYSADKMALKYSEVIASLKKSKAPDPIKQVLLEQSIQVYSTIFGNFDKPRKDIKVFTDKKHNMFRLPVMNAKIYKVLSHKYFSSPLTIYMDGNIFLSIPAQQLVDEFMQDADICLFKHPGRTCIYEEHSAARLRVPDDFKPLMDEQITTYRKEGMPRNFGLAECCMIIRRNNDVTNEFNERWWAEICRYTNRDQLSFPYIWWKMKDRIKINFIHGNIRANSYFQYIKH